MIDNKILRQIPKEFRESVKAAYEEDGNYIIELRDGWSSAAYITFGDELYKGDSVVKFRKERLYDGDSFEEQFENVSLDKADWCPACGIRNYVRLRQNKNRKYKIGCLQCNLWYGYIFDTEDEAYRAWSAIQKE